MPRAAVQTEEPVSGPMPSLSKSDRESRSQFGEVGSPVLCGKHRPFLFGMLPLPSVALVLFLPIDTVVTIYYQSSY